MMALVEIVSSRVKAELLRLLFGLGRPELHLRELARQSGLALGTVQQELRRLTRLGLVLARKDGNRVYYRANVEHPVHRDLCSLVLKTDGLVGILAPALKSAEVEVAFIFGSVARGETNAGSDVDLMVIGSASLRRVTGLLSGLGNMVGREINPHVMTPEEIGERQRQRDHFVSSLMNSPKVFIKGGERELAAMGK
jgi:predicted nucleotidyltransferase